MAVTGISVPPSATVASGSAIAQIGPGGAVLTYLLIGIMVYYIVTSLGELAAFMPVAGSFSTYASRYVDRGFGFALGWTLLLTYPLMCAVQLVSAHVGRVTGKGLAANMAQILPRQPAGRNLRHGAPRWPERTPWR